MYEIIDALKKRFGNKERACQQIGVGLEGWKTLATLANDRPLNQGRHSGTKDPGQLRDATEAELSEARGIARELIEKYVQWLRSKCGL